MNAYESVDRTEQNKVVLNNYSTSALLAMQSAVIATSILSVLLSVCHVPVLCAH